jgi:hypothetical protein
MKIYTAVSSTAIREVLEKLAYDIVIRPVPPDA